MKSVLFEPVAKGQVASCRVIGHFERGYLKVKVNGSYAMVRPDDHPDVEDNQREVFALPTGRSFDVWTVPQWEVADQLCIELYDSTDNLVDAHDTTVIPG